MWQQMGMEAFGFWRIHYALAEELARSKSMEFIWRSSDSLGTKNDMWSYIMPDAYCTPGECGYDGGLIVNNDPTLPTYQVCGKSCDMKNAQEERERERELLKERRAAFLCPHIHAFTHIYSHLHTHVFTLSPLPLSLRFDLLITIINTILFAQVNIEKQAIDFVNMARGRLQFVRHNHVLIPFGCDFAHQNAFHSFVQMDKLIDYVNAHPSLNATVQYSFFSDYVRAVNALNITWPVWTTKDGDFFPYAGEV